jgi:hypothetical protein
MRVLAAMGGPNPFRQMLGRFAVTLGRDGVMQEEYFTWALWRKDRGSAFLDFILPYWQQAEEVCQAGHESFPGHGIIGWDVFLTARGAPLNEANSNPGHVYQVAAQLPLPSAETRPAYDRALAFARRPGGGAQAL